MDTNDTTIIKVDLDKPKSLSIIVRESIQPTGIVQQYNDILKPAKDCRKKITLLIRDLLENYGFGGNSISSRVKKRQSFITKVISKKYTSIDDITDIVGIRIILYYADDVDKVAKVIEREFKIDTKNSIDKRAIINPDTFGYLSLHYVAQLDDVRSEMVEYQLFKNIKFEIQIRSILQHAWAEIEHSTKYKSELQVPPHITRDFCRLAGLLEVADSEFIRSRNAMSEYKASLIHMTDNTTINHQTLWTFIHYNEYINYLDNKVADNIPQPLQEITNLDISKYITSLDELRIKTTKDLIRLLKSNENIIFKYINKQVMLTLQFYPCTTEAFNSFKRGVSISALIDIQKDSNLKILLTRDII